MARCPNGSEASQPQGQSWEDTQLARGKQCVLEIWSPHAASSGQMKRLTVLMPALPDVPPVAGGYLHSGGWVPVWVTEADLNVVSSQRAAR